MKSSNKPARKSKKLLISNITAQNLPCRIILLFGGYSAFLFCFFLITSGCGKPTPEKWSVAAQVPEKIDFNFHVRPILSDRCFACHGPDEKARKASLRLDIKDKAFSLLDSAENTYAIVPGNLQKSQLFHRIKSSDPETVMPPPESNLQLSEREIKILSRWIEQGAEWKTHWAFIPPSKPDPPIISNNSWVKNPIDQFIGEGIERQGLQPAPEASKEKLIRRLSFDLRGLPPTLDEINIFLADQNPDAYEKLTDRFLSEKSFGERMAMEWLDLARYADSHGYQDDLERSMWPWRDWVIDAFNNNMPYDQFVSWQLSGDLLPNPTYEQKLATAFNRNHKITQEVGVIDEEYRVNYVLDRVNTFSSAFLGLTVECAQCHDHKYDPISQKEYYSLFGFFNNVPEKGRVDYGVEVAAPALPLPEKKVKALQDHIGKLLSQQKKTIDQHTANTWSEGLAENKISLEKKTASNLLPEGLVAYYPLDYPENGQLLEIKSQQHGTVLNDLIPVKGKISGGLEFTGTNFATLEPSRSFNFNKPFSLSFWIKSLDGGIRGAVLTTLTDKRHTPGFTLQVTGDKVLSFNLFNKQNKSGLSLISQATIPENEWTHIGVTYDGQKKSKGIKFFLNGIASETYIIKDDLRGNIPPAIELCLGTRNPLIHIRNKENNQGAYFSGQSKGLEAGQLDELLFFNRELSAEEIRQLNGYDPLPGLLAKKERKEWESKRLFYHQLLHQDPLFQKKANRFREYKIRQIRMDDIVTKPTMIMQDMDTLRPTYVLERGQYDAQRDRVNVGTPKAVLPFDQNMPKNRLGLSKWLFDPKNPLTARVAVNRYWQLIFEKGIVDTPGDFGSQGSLPTHPELLDWLAVDFIESGWDLKRLLKKMVLSATYRQSVTAPLAKQQKDPENLFLARGTRNRLAAETIRDHALAISGLLSNKTGGPSVKPYQPEGLWLEIASGNQSLRKYIQDHEDDLYRRSLYTFWKRTVPPPSMVIFDAPSREQCVLRRRLTSTPLQALVLLNDPQYTEAARLLATRMIREGGELSKDRIRFAFRLATSRLPDNKEITLLDNLFLKEKIAFDSNPEAAEKFLNIGEYPLTENENIIELAAYAVVAKTLLNLTETIQKG